MDDEKLKEAQELKARIADLEDRARRLDYEVHNGYNHCTAVTLEFYSTKRPEAREVEVVRVGISREHFRITFDNVLAIIRDAVRQDLAIARKQYEEL